MNFIRRHIVFFILLFATAILRFFPLFEYQFTYDELSGLDRTQFDSFGELIQKGVKIDAHPAFVQVLIFYIVKLFGFESWLLKLPFLLFSLGSVVYVYAIGVRQFSKRAGLYAATFLAFSLVFVFYAPIARMYSSGVFFSTGLLFYFFEIINGNKERTINYVLLGLFALLGALNHHMNALFAATVFGCAFLYHREINLKKFGFTCLACILLYLPNLPITLYQMSVGGIGAGQGGWLEEPDRFAVFDLVKIILGTGYLWVVVLLAIAFGIYLDRKKFSRKQLMLLIVFVVNYLVVYLYSILRAPVYQVSVMLFAGVAFILLVGSLLPSCHRVNFRITFTLLTTLLVFQSYIKKDYLNQAVKTVFDYQFERTAHYKKQFGEENVFPVFFDADTLMKKIYFKKYNTSFRCLISSDSAVSYGARVFYSTGRAGFDSLVSSVKLFGELVSGLQENYIALSSSTPLYQEIVKDHFPYLIEDTQTQGIHFQVYSKVPPATDTLLPDLYFSDPLHQGFFNYQYASEKSEKVKNSFNLAIDSADVFPFSGTCSYDDVITSEGQFVLTRTKLDFRNYNGRFESCVVVKGRDNALVSYNARSSSDYIMKKDSTVVMYADGYIGNFHHKRIPGKKLSCYLWNKAGEQARLTEFEVRVIDHWHQKWHFWD